MSAIKYAKQAVNIRKGPGTDYEKIGSLTMNQKVTVTGQADNGWYRISYNGGDAYVSNKYLVDNKIETNTNEATDNGGNSDNGGENNNGSDDTTDNSNRDDGNGSGSNTPTPEPETPAPVEPVVTRTPDEVLSMLDSAYRAAGMTYFWDEFPNSKYGPTTMGWGLRPISSKNKAEELMMINANKREDGVRLVKELQGKSINQGKNLIKEYAGYSVGCKMKIQAMEEINNKDGFTIYITFSLLDERNDSIVECIGVREFGIVANVYPTVEEMCKVIDELGMDVDKEQDLESICGDFVDSIGCYRITDFEAFYGNFAKVGYQWEVFPTEEEMICWEDIEE